MQANAQVLADSVEDRRQSVAGVSMDEEMSNLVRFQRAYQAPLAPCRRWTRCSTF